jgi:D-glycero-alpha-D-manno-heptose-7-phosphate kinase
MIEHVVNAVAPTRVCDLGGWTDTWFAGHGAVFNIAVYPYVEVQIESGMRSGNKDRVTLSVENYGDRYSVNPDDVTYDKHPLIEAAIDFMKVPEDCALTINIFSEAPPGASMGTSAAVSVALVGALAAMWDQQLTPHEIASLAHYIETEKLGMQSGIQDQLASAYGGISFMNMYEFPHASVSPLLVPNTIWWELEHRLAVIYIGTPHSSSETHKKVIAELGDNASQDTRLTRLREMASEGKAALYTGDFESLGACMNENTECQRQLHPELVCEDFENIISIANDFGALGCKVNGAGGDGGSLAILTDGNMAQKRRLLTALTENDYKPLPIYLSRQGLRVWKRDKK